MRTAARGTKAEASLDQRNSKNLQLYKSDVPRNHLETLSFISGAFLPGSGEVNDTTEATASCKRV